MEKNLNIVRKGEFLLKQLLQITTVPISYNFKIQHAQVERHHGSAKLEMSRNKGGMQIENTPIK